MCAAPERLSSGQHVACNRCRECRQRRVDDFVGRCLAEAQTSRAVRSVTLTYAENPMALRYKDVQLWIKSLRNAGHDVRYFAAGEYGYRKGRPHWHIILFEGHRGKLLAWPERSRFNDPVWPHGFMFAHGVDEAAIRYVCKYALKDHEHCLSSGGVRMSKKPALGAAFFSGLADEYVRQQLPINGPEYSFAGVNVYDRLGKVIGPRRFWMMGHTRDAFLSRYVALWRATYGAEPPMTDYLVEQYFDPIAAREVEEERVSSFTPASAQAGLLVVPPRILLLSDSAIAFSVEPTGEIFIADGTEAKCRIGNVKDGASALTESLTRRGLASVCDQSDPRSVLSWLLRLSSGRLA